MRITMQILKLSRREHAHSKQSLHAHVHEHMYVRTRVSFTAITRLHEAHVYVFLKNRVHAHMT